MNVVEPVLHFGVTRKGTPALVASGRTISYGELAEQVRRTAGHLANLGVQRGDRIGLCLKDTPEHIIALLGVTYLGGVAVPLDWRARANESGRLIDGLNLKCVLAEPGARLPANCAAIPIDADWSRAVANANAAGDPAQGWDSPFVISATSGSTGDPRFTLMTHVQYQFAIAGMLELMGLQGRHRFLSTLPLYYSGGRNSCLTHLLRGDCVVFYPSLFTAAEYIDLIRAHQITVAAVVPSAIRQLLAADGSEPLLPGLTKLFCTGAPLHAEEKILAARKLTPCFNERYGTAETLAISVLKPDDLAGKADSVGQAHSMVRVEIADEGDQALSGGGVGRLRLRGPGVGTPLQSKSEEGNFREGWFYPGEIARLDEDGYIFLLGRESDVVMRSGAKVYPAEVERTLAGHACVMEAAVVGQRGADNEEVVVAFVVPRGTTTTGDLIAYCRARLTAHKVPQRICFLEQMPRNASGKTDKLSLTKLLSEDPAH